jgi:hypothetical protein
MKVNMNASLMTNIYKRIQITTSDAKNGYIEGRDSSGQAIRLSFSFYYSPYIQIPQIGEDWVVKKIDNNWTLYGRYELSDNQITPVTSLHPGDVRIESKNRLFINADQEIIMDFNKAIPSLAKLGTSTIPGSAIYGSVSLDYINVGTAIIGSAFIGTANIGFGTATIGTASIGSAFIGTATIGTASIGTSTTNTVYITNKLTRPIGTALPTSGVVDGQEEHLLAEDSHGIIWSFRYRSSSASSYKWESVGASTHINFSTASYSLTSPNSTIWYGNGTPEQIYIPYTGEYLICNGVQVLSSSNNSPYRFGVTTSGTAGTPVIYFTGYCNTSSDSTTTSSNYFGTFTAGNYINQVYQSPAGHNLTISQRWFAVQPIRVTT